MRRAALRLGARSLEAPLASARLASSYVGISDFVRGFETSGPPTSLRTRRPDALASQLLVARTAAPFSGLRWRRQFHASSRRPEQRHAARDSGDYARSDELHHSAVERASKTPATAPPHVDTSHLPEWVRRLAKSLPHTSLKRPNRDELLAATNSFWQSLRIRFKWFTIRGFRPYRADDWSAFVSWAVGGVGLWIVIGTTSFFAVVFGLVNSLQLQEWLARRLGKYLTESAGITIVFESAIVPRFSIFGDSRISFRNVYVSRGAVPSEREPTLGRRGFRRDETTGIAAETVRKVVDALSVAQADASDHGDPVAPVQAPPVPIDAETANDVPAATDPMLDPANWSRFHLAIDSIDVSLDLGQWLDGRGLIKDAVVRGVRGVIDRSHIKVDPTANPDRRAYRHKAHPGDFDLSGLTLEDVLVTVYQPDRFRPFTISVFSAQLSRLRKQWLFLDCLSAESITGQADNCLFSLHKPQTIARTSEQDLKQGLWKRMSRFRIDGVPIDHLQSRSETGPISWITSGRCDIVADIRFPREPEDDVDLNSIIGGIVDRLDEVVIRGQPLDGPERIPGQPELVVGQAIEAPSSLRRRLGLEESSDGLHQQQRAISMDLDFRFKDVKASLPVFTSQLSYVSNALVRPIVAFINANRTLVPVKCRVDLPLDDFNGSWTAWHVGLLDAVSQEVYAALAYHVQHSAGQGYKTVGLWSLQLTAQAVLSALRNLDHFTTAPAT